MAPTLSGRGHRYYWYCVRLARDQLAGVPLPPVVGAAPSGLPAGVVMAFWLTVPSTAAWSVVAAGGAARVRAFWKAVQRTVPRAVDVEAPVPAVQVVPLYRVPSARYRWKSVSYTHLTLPTNREV